MKLLISGSTGFIGSALTQRLRDAGHSVVRLVRSQHGGDDAAVRWQPDQKGTRGPHSPSNANGGPLPNAIECVWGPQQIDAADLEGVDAVIHLAGENIAGRWTEKKKRAIRESRAKGTRLLSTAIAGLNRRPLSMICASAVGYYGDRGDDWLDESAEPGTGFLPEVCIEWEAACEPARDAGIRVANLRFGLILSPEGGALAAMLTPFKLGIAGVMGSGNQWWSWITLDDVLSIIEFAVNDDRAAGPVNVVAPEPVTNRQFTKTLGKVLSRPTVLPMPAAAAKIAFGAEMARETMLASARVRPRRLMDLGCDFRFPQLEPALRHLLG